MQLHPTDRDFDLLNWLWNVRYATPRQINKHVFRGTARCTVTNRLKALQEAGVILVHRKPIYEAGDTDRKIVTISRNGIAQLNRAYPTRHIRADDVPKTDQGSLRKSCILHDLALVDVGIRLSEQLPERTWISEHRLRVHFRQQADTRSRTPDAIFTYSVGGEEGVVVVENVRIPYSQKRFVEALGLLLDQYPDAVQLWVGADVASIQTMVRWTENHPAIRSRRDQIVFSLHSDFMDHGLKGTLVAVDGVIGDEHILRQAVAEADAARGAASGDESEGLADQA